MDRSLPSKALTANVESFFLYCYGHRRDLHSFPTRRSSDLVVLVGVLTRRRPLHAATRVLAQPRSEEHTSELQSRLHLVCRLLLEKKKNSPDAQRRDPTAFAHGSLLATLMQAPCVIGLPL